LDLADALPRHHGKYLAGKSPLGVESADPAEVERHFQGRLPFRCTAATSVSENGRLVGARLWYLDGVVTAICVYHRGSSVVTVAASDLDRFPMSLERLRSEGEVHCRVRGLPFLLAADATRSVSAVRDVPPEELSLLTRDFLAR
jgi:hypothetical protein